MEKENGNVVFCPPCGENVGLPTKRGFLNKESSFTTPLPACGVLPPQGGQITAGGFTLIELLVVVLIIGILAAVAVPQYQKAVEKSKAVQGITLVKSLAQAAQAYYLANGEHATSLDQLDVSLSDAQKEEFYCNSLWEGCNQKEWGVLIYKNIDDDYAILGLRTSGNYKGGGFLIYQKKSPSLIQPNTLYCYERYEGPNAIETKGNYCQKLFNATYIGPIHNGYMYALP